MKRKYCCLAALLAIALLAGNAAFGLAKSAAEAPVSEAVAVDAEAEKADEGKILGGGLHTLYMTSL